METTLLPADYSEITIKKRQVVEICKIYGLIKNGHKFALSQRLLASRHDRIPQLHCWPVGGFFDRGVSMICTHGEYLGQFSSDKSAAAPDRTAADFG